MTHSVRESALSPEVVAESLHALRERSPLVQCLTNIVVANFTANVLLASGAAPAMVDNAAEAEPFARVADAVLVNLGTPYPVTVSAMASALRGAGSGGTPWVLDPVAAGALEWRTSIAQALLDQHPPAVLRGNASEVIAIAGHGTGGRGVESVDTVDGAVDLARELSRDRGAVVAVSGEVDHLTDGDRLVRVANGHPWLTQVTGAGCALGALMAAFTAVTADPLVAATSATATFTVAAERAAEQSAGPGSFAVSLIDQLAALSPDDLAAAVRLS